MHHDKIADVHVGALLTVTHCRDVRTDVQRAFIGHDLVRLWLDEVDQVDAAGLGLLVGLHRLARQLDATLVCVNPSARLTKTLRRRGLERVLRLQFVIVDEPSGAQQRLA